MLDDRRRQLVLDRERWLRARAMTFAKQFGVAYDDVLSNVWYAACRLAEEWDGRGDWAGFLNKFLWYRIVDLIRRETGVRHVVASRPVLLDPTTSELETLGPSQIDSYFFDRQLVLSGLSERDRFVLVETLEKGRSLRDVADEMGVTESAVCRFRKAAFHRLLQGEQRER